MDKIERYVLHYLGYKTAFCVSVVLRSIMWLLRSTAFFLILLMIAAIVFGATGMSIGLIVTIMIHPTAGPRHAIFESIILGSLLYPLVLTFIVHPLAVMLANYRKAFHKRYSRKEKE